VKVHCASAGETSNDDSNQRQKRKSLHSFQKGKKSEYRE
jgi:hypothetical protein